MPATAVRERSIASVLHSDPTTGERSRMRKTKKLSLHRETLRTLIGAGEMMRVAGGGTAGAECSGNFTSCASQWPNCRFTSTCPVDTSPADTCGTLPI